MGVLERCRGQTSEAGSNKRLHYLDDSELVVGCSGGGGCGGKIDMLMVIRGKTGIMERDVILLVCGIVLGYLSMPRSWTAS